MNFNILGIGLPQIAIVMVLALVLFGPKKMLEYAYQAGKYLSEMRKMFEEASRNVQKELADAGLNVQELKTLGSDLTREITGTLDPVNNGNGSTQSAQPFQASTAILGTTSSPVSPAAPTAPTSTPNESIPNSTEVKPDKPSLDLSTGPSAPPADSEKKYDAWLPN